MAAVGRHRNHPLTQLADDVIRDTVRIARDREASLMVSVELRARVGSGYVVIALRGELDSVDAQSPGSAVSELAEGGQLLIIDLDALEYGLVLLPLVGAPGVTASAAAALPASAEGIPGMLASRP